MPEALLVVSASIVAVLGFAWLGAACVWLAGAWLANQGGLKRKGDKK